jgi:hypothetical protein
MDNTIESNLKTLPLFQKLVKLFLANVNPSTSFLAPSSSLETNQVVTSQQGPTNTDPNKSVAIENLNSMATTYQNKPTVPAKPSHSSNKHTKKSPYNSKSPKKHLTTAPIAAQEKPSLNENIIPSLNNPSLSSPHTLGDEVETKLL